MATSPDRFSQQPYTFSPDRTIANLQERLPEVDPKTIFDTVSALSKNARITSFIEVLAEGQLRKATQSAQVKPNITSETLRPSDKVQGFTPKAIINKLLKR